MIVMNNEEIISLIRKYALLNAIKYGGKADTKSVVGKVISERPDLRQMIQEILRLSDAIISEINSMALHDQQKLARNLGLQMSKEKVKEERHLLPPLPNVHKYPRVRVRFAPNPDFAIHLGNSRAAILNDEYAKMYNGIFILRFEDTSPSVKPPMLEAYESIREDLKWLGIDWKEEYIQSQRLEIYYDYAKRIIELSKAYICTCKPEIFRKLLTSGIPCPCRNLPVEEHLRRWEGMLSGATKRGEAVMRIKTELNHPNPAVREWPAMRIDPKPHPLQGTKYRVWPLYNFACAIDDHLMGITHILRGKEHEINTIRQRYLYEYFGWEYPEVIHYGRLKIEGTMLSKSKMRRGIEEGIFMDWSDPRLGTIAALRKRGILPETIRQIILEVGVKPSEATISWKNLEAINRKILDPIAKRFIFIQDPIAIEVKYIPKEFCAKIPFHPNHLEWGYIEYKISPNSSTILVQSKDVLSLNEGSVFRLMNLFNVRKISSTEYSFFSEDIADVKKFNSSIIQWLPYGVGIEISIVMKDGSKIKGIVDNHILEESFPNSFQFYRFGFVRVYKVDNELIGYYSHD